MKLKACVFSMITNQMKPEKVICSQNSWELWSFQRSLLVFFRMNDESTAVWRATFIHMLTYIIGVDDVQQRASVSMETRLPWRPNVDVLIRFCLFPSIFHFSSPIAADVSSYFLPDRLAEEDASSSTQNVGTFVIDDLPVKNLFVPKSCSSHFVLF